MQLDKEGKRETMIRPATGGQGDTWEMPPVSEKRKGKKGKVSYGWEKGKKKGKGKGGVASVRVNPIPGGGPKKKSSRNKTSTGKSQWARGVKALNRKEKK